MKARPLPRSMRPGGGSKTGPLSQAQQRWDQLRDTQLLPRWQALAPRERLGLTLAAVALGLLLFWSVAVAPALSSLRRLPPIQAELQAQLTQMQLQATESARLRQQPPLPAAQAEAALRAATDKLGPLARLNLQGDRATVQFNGIEGAAFVTWLGEVRSGARARPVDAQLSRVGSGYSGSVTLQLTSGG